MLPTHWIILPIKEAHWENVSLRVDLPKLYGPRALQEFNKLGRLVEGPWFVRIQEGSLVLSDGKLLRGPSLIYYAVLDTGDEVRATVSPAPEPTKVGRG